MSTPHAPSRFLVAALAALAMQGCSTDRGDAASPVPDAGAEAQAARLRPVVRPLALGEGDYDALLQRVGDARVVLIGEATHGTHEFYRERARITRLLMERRGFTTVAVEGDWPRARRVDRYALGEGGDRDAAQALGSFTEFPRWTWRNQDVRAFVEWMRARNAVLPAGAAPARFRGLDLYSVFPSADEVVAYLESADRAAGSRARARYSCFERYDDDPAKYARAVAGRETASCEDEAAAQLEEMRGRAAPPGGEDALFDATRNAAVVAHGEAYFRASTGWGNESWNLRDRHMQETLEALVERGEKVVVWAHNSHVGDARATELSAQGQLTLGQLARQRFGAGAVLVGFTTHAGTVMAARDWDEPGAVRTLRPSLPGSWESLFHAVGTPDFVLLLSDAAGPLGERRLERAVGVVYRPETERESHYFATTLPERFDVVIHIDRTTAVEAF